MDHPLIQFCESDLQRAIVEEVIVKGRHLLMLPKSTIVLSVQLDILNKDYWQKQQNEATRQTMTGIIQCRTVIRLKAYPPSTTKTASQFASG